MEESERLVEGALEKAVKPMLIPAEKLLIDPCRLIPFQSFLPIVFSVFNLLENPFQICLFNLFYHLKVTNL